MGFSWSDLDPTSGGSFWRKGLRAVDPTNPNSLERKYYRALDPTTPGSVGYYAAPVAAGAALGPVAGAAVGGLERAATGGNVAEGAAASYGLGAIGSNLSPSAPPPASVTTPTEDASTPQSSAPSGNGDVTAPAAPAQAGASSRANIGKFLTEDPRLIPAVLAAAADIYGASQQGAAQDRLYQLQRDIAEHDVGRGGLAVRMPYDTWMASRRGGA